MILSRRTACLALATACLGASTGCLERTETITIAADGAINIELHYKFAGDDIDRHGALPTPEGGWKVVRSEQGPRDDRKQILDAQRSFRPGETLPETFAAPADPNPDVYLHFPTIVRREEREDGTYYYFHRRYVRRDWAYAHYWQEYIIDEHHHDLAGKPVEEMTREERQALLEALAAVEALKQSEFALAALAECDPELAPEYRLLAREAMFAAFSAELDCDNLSKLCPQDDADERNACFEAESERILENGRNAFAESLVDRAGYDRQAVARWQRSFDRVAHYHAVTDELGGDSFKMRVSMPGTVVAHNADDVDEEGGVSSAAWDFNGKIFRDRDFELWFITRLDSPSDTEETDATASGSNAS